MRTISNITYPMFALFALACFALSPTARATEDRGNGNSAAEDVDALNPASTGSENTAHGWFSLLSNDTGSFNVAEGFRALSHNLTGFNNTAIGWQALIENTIGFQNTAVGAGSMNNNTTGIDSTAVGAAALHENTTGRFNTATGFQALAQNTTGELNTADGLDTLFNNTTGKHNTAIGVNALHQNTTGSRNIALGVGAGAILTTGNDNIDIGNGGIAGESETIRIGEDFVQFHTYIAGIFGSNIGDGSPVVVTADGHLGVGATSSRRFKDDIKPMDKASEAIFALKPVTFCYKSSIDPRKTAQFGLVAEEVEKVNPSLVGRDKEGKPYSVRYEAVNAMLLNEFLKEHRKVETLEATVASLTATVKEQATQIQKVSAQLEVTKSAPRTALNNQ